MTTQFKQNINQKKDQLKNQFKQAVEPFINIDINEDDANKIYWHLFKHSQIRETILADDFKGFSIDDNAMEIVDQISNDFDTIAYNQMSAYQVETSLLLIVPCFDSSMNPDGHVIALIV